MVHRLQPVEVSHPRHNQEVPEITDASYFHGCADQIFSPGDEAALLEILDRASRQRARASGITRLDHVRDGGDHRLSTLRVLATSAVRMAPPIPPQPIDQLPDLGNLHVSHGLTNGTQANHASPPPAEFPTPPPGPGRIGLC